MWYSPNRYIEAVMMFSGRGHAMGRERWCHGYTHDNWALSARNQGLSRDICWTKLCGECTLTVDLTHSSLVNFALWMLIFVVLFDRHCSRRSMVTVRCYPLLMLRSLSCFLVQPQMFRLGTFWISMVSRHYDRRIKFPIDCKCGLVVMAPDLKSGGCGFKACSDHYLDLFLGSPLFKSLVTLCG